MGRRPKDRKHAPMDVSGKAVVISGGTKGIGRATALLLASEGARVLQCNLSMVQIRPHLQAG